MTTDPYTLRLSAALRRSRDSDVFAWSVRARLPWFRALPVSCVERVLLSAGGEPVAEEDVLFHVDGQLLSLSGLQAMRDRYWSIEESLQIGVGHGGPVPVAGTEVGVELTLRMPEGAGADGEWPRRTTRASARLAGAEESPWAQGVCTFSFAGELRRGRSLRSCLDEVAALGGFTAVELLGAQVIEGYPAPAPQWLERFSDMLRETGLVPLCYDGFLDPGRSADRTTGDADVLRWAETELALASALGSTYVRLNVPLRRSLFERLAESAERHGLVVLTELHAQTPQDASVQTLLGLLDELRSPRLGLIVDLSCVMRALPRGFTRLLTGTGAAPDVARLVEDAWSDGIPLPALEAELAGRTVSDETMEVTRRAYRLFRRSDPGWLPDLLPFTRIVHGKFYEMESGHEPAIAYPDVLATLARTQFDGCLMTEYEGHLWDDSPDTFGQLLAHRRMISAGADV
ncbi:TIM barrel protein [Streptomyces sp. NPDC101776]|uniref:TIM barrel protein n=1 Tax=Streptomyces sp. NPDC101776 TaxID=3366146 RepID=UPI00382501DB